MKTEVWNIAPVSPGTIVVEPFPVPTFFVTCLAEMSTNVTNNSFRVMLLVNN